MGTIELTVTFETIACADCAMQFAVPPRFITDRRADHERFYCPMGHRNYYAGKSDVEKLKDQLRRQEESTNYFSKRLEEVYEAKTHVEHRLRAQKGQVTRIKNRVSKGVCPCCNRTFADLARHMENKHPDFTQASTERETKDSTLTP